MDSYYIKHVEYGLCKLPFLRSRLLSHIYKTTRRKIILTKIVEQDLALMLLLQIKSM